MTFLGATASGITFASAADMDGVATLLQAALRGTSEASLDAVEVVHDGTQFVITLPLSSDGSATEVTAAFTGANADELGLDTVDTTPGIDGIGAGFPVVAGFHHNRPGLHRRHFLRRCGPDAPDRPQSCEDSDGMDPGVVLNLWVPDAA